MCGLGDKIEDPLFLVNLTSDINILLETWKDDSDKYKVIGYNFISKARKKILILHLGLEDEITVSSFFGQNGQVINLMHINIIRNAAYIHFAKFKINFKIYYSYYLEYVWSWRQDRRPTFLSKFNK
jgi:hypothetical protein